MKIALEKFKLATPKYPVLVQAVLKVATVKDGFVEIDTGQYFRIAQKNKVSFMEAKSVITGQTVMGVGMGMAKGLAGTVVKTAVAAVTGQQVKVTPEQKQARMDICQGNTEKGMPKCEFYLAEQQRCSKCGCPLRSHMPDKWDFAQSDCPEGMWAKIS